MIMNWFEGEILYFNNKLEEYRITYSDGSSDYVAPEDMME